jgi:hypothetical protein
VNPNPNPPPATRRPTDPQPPPAAPRPPTQVDGEEAGYSGAVGWGVALIAGGTLWLLSLLGLPIRLELVLPIALVVIGGLLLLGGRWIARGGLIGLGVVVAVVALVVSTTPAATSFTAGERVHTVTDVAELEPSYGLGAGSLTVDLRGLELPEGTTELTVDVAMGELIVLAPPDVAVTGEGRAAMGEVSTSEDSRGGIAPRLTWSQPGDEDGRVLDLDLRVGLGSIEVDR